MPRLAPLQVKICGITRVEDALAAVAAGADALGFVFYEKSRRSISIADAAAVCAALKTRPALVGLFVNADVDFVCQVLTQVPLTLLQFHGDESPEYCSQFEMPYLKAVHVDSECDDVLRLQQQIDEQTAGHDKARGFVFDAAVGGVSGGTGKRFEWSSLSTVDRSRLILAGGLNPDNVADAIALVKPQAVDVSSGVEQLPGIKDEKQVAAFITAARAAAAAHGLEASDGQGIFSE